MILANDLVRALLRAGLPFAARRARAAFGRRIADFDGAQRHLRETYGIAADTPIVGYDDATRARVHALAAADPGVALAYTSGTTGAPKALAYPPARLRSFKADSQSVGVQAWHHLGLRGGSFFVLGGLGADQSFASLVLHRGRPSWLTGVIEPARHLSAMADILADYGAGAARLWLLLLADPGMIYSTNPSTLAVFLAELQGDWRGASALARAWSRGSLAGHAGLARIVGRTGAAGHEHRMRFAADSSEAPAFADLLPGLGAYCCWDGGYVTGFLRQIQAALPPARFRHVPMYAMSTETIETLPWFDDTGAMRFLPLGPQVLYELLPEGAPDDPTLLLPPTAARDGERYTMVVSDPYGLRRYQTEDLFRCHGHVSGLPDLRFERRRGLAWSFTGEKLTGEQAVAAFSALERAHPALAALSAQLTLLPSWPPGSPLPGYRLLVAHPGSHVAAPPDLDALARDLDAALTGMNDEYAGKRSTGRLALPVAALIAYDRLAAALDARRGGDATARGWESQFKLMPLTRVMWEELNSPPHL